MRIIGCLFLVLSCFNSSCFNSSCIEEYRRIRDLKYRMTIIKNYYEDHSSWLIGRNSDGKLDTFQYHSFHYLHDVALINTELQKDSGTSVFIVKNDTCKFILNWDCKTGGGLDSIIKLK